MTREETKKCIEVMQAYVNGKAIIADSAVTNKTYDVENPIWNWCADINTYRIKPQPQYKPYDDVSEVQRDKWVRVKGTKTLYRIDVVDESNPYECVYTTGRWRSLKALFDDFEYEDGTPCGKLVSE